MNNQAIPPNGRAAGHHAAGAEANRRAQPIAGAAQNLARELGNAQLHQGPATQHTANHANRNNPFINLLWAQTFDDLLACRADLEHRLLMHPNVPTSVVSNCIKDFIRVIVANAHLIPQLAGAQRMRLVAFATFLAEFTQSQARSLKIVKELPPEVALCFLKCLPEAAMDRPLNPPLMEIRRTLGLHSIKEDESRCLDLPSDLFADQSFAQELTIAHADSAFGFISPELRETPYFEKLLRYATGESTLEDPEVNEDRRDATIVTAAAAYNSNELYFMDDTLKSNRQFLLNTVKHQPSVLEHETAGFRNDLWFILASVDDNGHALRYAPPEFRNFVEIVTAAVENNGDALSHASGFFKDNFVTVLAAVKQSPRSLQYASDRVKDNHEFVVAASTLYPGAFRYASDRLKGNFSTVLAIVSQHGLNLEAASSNLRNDQHIVMAAIKQNPMALQFASAALRNNLDIAAAAVQKNGLALQFTLEKPRLDRAIVMSAISSSGMDALPFAPEFQTDYVMVEVAKMHLPNLQTRQA